MKIIFHLHDGSLEEFHTEKKTVIIGRGTLCDIIITHEGFSRRHAQIEIENGEIFVTDLQSTNGVLIEGERIPSFQKTPIQSFLNLQIGPAIKVEIIDDTENIEPTISIPELKLTASKKINVTSLSSPDKSATRTINVKNLKPLVKKPPQSTKAPLNFVIVFLLPLSILGTAFYFYSAPNEFQSENQADIPKNLPKDVPLTETAFLIREDFNLFAQESKCSPPHKMWCDRIGFSTGQNEGVIAKNRTLLFYFDLSEELKMTSHSEFQALHENDKIQILALKRIFVSDLVPAFSRQTEFDNAQFALGIKVDGLYKLKVVLKINRNIALNDFDKFAAFTLFDQIILKGITGEVSKVSGLYEKIILN
jgi:hypothetical protein